MKHKHTYHIWLGLFKTLEDYEQYFAENPEAFYDDDQPINAFIKDQGQLFYDNDLGEHNYYDDTFDSLEQFIRLASYGDQYVEALMSLIQAQDLKSVNTFCMLETSELKQPCSVINHQYQFHYMGVFDCGTSA